MEEATFTDRYDGIGTPCKWTACKGPCEGIGVYFMPFIAWEGLATTPGVTVTLKVCPQQREDGSWEIFPPLDPSESIVVYCHECGGDGLRRRGIMRDLLELAYVAVHPTRMFFFALGPAGWSFWEGHPNRVRNYLAHAVRVAAMVEREDIAIARAAWSRLKRRGT